MSKTTKPAAKGAAQGPQARVMPNGDILIMGVIGDWFGGLDAATFTEEVRALEKDPLKVFINSPGGSVTDGLAIYNELVAHESKVEVTVTALAASMASVIMLAGDTVRMPANALVMIHNPWTYVAGDKHELEKVQRQLEKMGESILGIYARRTGMREKDLEAMMDAETWLNAEEALEYGFIDEILPDAPAEDFTQIDDKTVANMPDRMAAMVRAYQTAAASKTPADVAATKAKKETPMAAKPKDEPATNPAAGTKIEPTFEAVSTVVDAVDADAIAQAAIKKDRERTAAIRKGCETIGLDEDFQNELINSDKTLAECRAAILDKAADRTDSQPPFSHHVRVGEDQRDKFLSGAVSALIHRAGQAGIMAKAKVALENPGEFRGFNLTDLARHCLEMNGSYRPRMSREDVVRAALTPTYGSAYQGTSDFTTLLENAMHKILQASYMITPDTWARFCKKGSVTDFRPHNRYRVGALGSLDDVLENGEFKNKAIPDGEKASITATTKGNIIALSRQAIVNDDMNAFETLAAAFGRAAKLTVEKKVYAVLAENSGDGPALSDGKALFHADHGNIDATPAAPTVASFGTVSDTMAAQKAVGSTEEFLDLHPEIFLGTRALARAAVAVNDSEYDPDASNKLQKKNVARNTYSDIIGTARLSGTAWYSFADPAVAPVLEVAFLDGIEEPFMEMQEGFRTDGVEWKCRLDFGVAGIDYRGAVRNAGQ